MTYKITGLSPHVASPSTGLDDAALAALGARRVVATAKPGFPCRVTLEDADLGETLILFNHVSHDVDGPFRNAFAIFVREKATRAAAYVDALPPVMQQRPLAMKGYDKDGMMVAARLSLSGEAEAAICALFSDPAIAYIHAHNAAHGCFAAAIERTVA